MNIRDLLDGFNAFAWVGGNVLLAYAMAILLVYLVLYALVFDPRATTGGRLIFRFMNSLLGVLILVFIGVYIDPAPGREWYTWSSETVGAWRPIFRLVFYGYLSWTVSNLLILLIKRKWFPHKLKKASDLDLVKPRSETKDIHLPGKES